MFRAEDVTHDQQVRAENIRHERAALAEYRRDEANLFREIEEVADGYDKDDPVGNRWLCGSLQDKIRYLNTTQDAIEQQKAKLRALGEDADRNGSL